MKEILEALELTKDEVCYAFECGEMSNTAYVRIMDDLDNLQSVINKYNVSL